MSHEVFYSLDALRWTKQSFDWSSRADPETPEENQKTLFRHHALADSFSTVTSATTSVWNSETPDGGTDTIDVFENDGQPPMAFSLFAWSVDAPENITSVDRRYAYAV